MTSSRTGGRQVGRRLGRRLARRVVATLLAAGAAVVGVLAGSAALTPTYADVPVGWGDQPRDVDLGHALLLLGGAPLLLALLIAAAVYAPSLVRGEDVTPAGAETPMADQWLGGPRSGTRELAGPDDGNSQAGGARGHW